MRLSKWIEEQDISFAEFASRILLRTGRRVSAETIRSVALGRIPREAMARAISEVTDGAVALADLLLPEGAMPVRAGGPGMVRIPILGSIAAGVPIKAQPSVEGDAEVPAAWVGHADCYAVRVSGESMIGAGIMPHDLVVVRPLVPGEKPLDGDVVVATVEGETTLKRWRQKGGKVLLVPENPAMKAIELGPGKAENVEIQGVVVGQMRSYHRPEEAKKRGRGAKA